MSNCAPVCLVVEVGGSPHMAGLDTGNIAALLREIADRSTLSGANPYRSRAFARAARNLAAFPMPLAGLSRSHLKAIPGVGDTIADIIVALRDQGRHPWLEELRAQGPDSLRELIGIPGLSPEMIAKLHAEAGIATLDALEAALKAKQIRGVKGLGPAAQKKILAGIALKRAAEGALLVDEAEETLDICAVQVRRKDATTDAVLAAGDFRRGCELVGDLALVAVSAKAADHPEIKTFEGCRVTLTSPHNAGATLLYATGSAAHLTALEALAAKKGRTLTRSGLFKGERVTASEHEADIYAALGLAFIPPELREGLDEIKLAQRKALPDLVTDTDIKGALHVHTDASDGVATLEEIAEAAIRRGYAYLGITDHSQSAYYAHGLSLDAVAAQRRQIARLNAKLKGRLHIFAGIEADILEDGSLDYPGDVLAGFDFVVASIHSRFALDGKAQTKRMLKAIANPYTTILGHITGRQLLRRPGYDLDMEAVLEACARHGVAIEVNCNPLRLELDWRWHRTALRLGCQFSIDPDAHSTAELDFMRWGVSVARKGGVPKNRVLNCMQIEDFERLLDRRRERARG